MKGKEAEQLHEDFFGHPVEYETEIDVADMSNLTFLGIAHAIEYKAQKYSDRKEHIYRHEFENDALVLTNGKEIIIYGKRIRITKRGIEG